MFCFPLSFFTFKFGIQKKITLLSFYLLFSKICILYSSGSNFIIFFTNSHTLFWKQKKKWKLGGIFFSFFSLGLRGRSKNLDTSWNKYWDKPRIDPRIKFFQRNLDPSRLQSHRHNLSIKKWPFMWHKKTNSLEYAKLLMH